MEVAARFHPVRGWHWATWERLKPRDCVPLSPRGAFSTETVSPAPSLNVCLALCPHTSHLCGFSSVVWSEWGSGGAQGRLTSAAR